MTTDVQTPKKKATNAIAKLNGVLVDKVNRDALARAMRLLKLKVNDEEDVRVLITRMSMHCKENVHENDLAQCDVCEGISPVDLPVCAYCGTEDEEQVQDADSAPAPEDKPVKAEKIEKKEDATMKTVETKEGSAKKAKAHVNGVNGAAALVPVKSSALRKHDESTLDALVKEVHRLKGEAAGGMWRLGQKIDELVQTQVWKERTDEDGKPHRWRSFEAFCNHELRMTPQNAHLLAAISREYSEEEVRELGPRKLGLILSAPKEERGALLEKAKTSTSGKVKEEVSKARQKHGVSKGMASGTKRSALTGAATRDTSKAREAKAKKMQVSDKIAPRGDRIVVANMLGKKTIRLYKGPVVKGETPKDSLPARKLGDGPWGKLELSNGVVQYCQVTESPTGELKLVVTTAREVD